MTNVSLIYPLLSKKRSRIDENKQFWPPLGLAYIAAVLENKGHRVNIIDRDLLLRKNGMDFEAVDRVTLEIINDFEADVVGIGGTTPTFTDVAHVAKLVKNDSADRIVVAGGPHVTGEAVLSLQESPHIDIVVRGEGELTMLDIASGKGLSEISGISFRSNGKVISNANRALYPNLDELPFPARHLLDMDFYTRPSRFTSRNLSLRTTSIFTARGCPYACNYCAGPLMFEGKVRFHSPERVITEINELVDKYSVEAIYFAEDMFLSSKARAVNFMQLLMQSGLNKKVKWFAQVRSNIVDLELLGLMKDAGCVHVEYGFESGSQRVLDLMQKRVKVEDNLSAARLTRKSGLRFQANIIVGYPQEKEEDFLKTVQFIRKVRPSSIGFNIFMPLPGTRIYNQLKEEGKALPAWDEIGDPEGNRIYYADMPEGRFEELYFKARLKVVLPINLYYFIKDNLNRPVRLVRVLFSQFKGVIVKTIRSLYRLTFPKGRQLVLYVSYNGASEPVFQSQGLAYLRGLSAKGVKFVLLTFEKRRAHSGPILETLSGSDIIWHSLNYHKRPANLATVWDILLGNICISYLILRYRINAIHARGVIAGAMAFLPARIFRNRFIFDIRSSLAGAYASAGYWSRNSANYKIVKSLEDFFTAKADSVIAETEVHSRILSRLSKNRKAPPIKVIPCCVDLARFDYKLIEPYLSSKEGVCNTFRLLYIGSLSGWYMLPQMLDFFKALKGILGDSEFSFFVNDLKDSMLLEALSAERSLGSVKILALGYNDLPREAARMSAGIVFTKPMERLESVPVKIGEYLCGGLPVILNSGMGDAEEIVRDNNVGAVVEEFTPQSYKQSILKLIELMRNDGGLKARCRRVAEKYFALSSGISKYYEVYTKLGLYARAANG